jgi:hypothetical protein
MASCMLACSYLPPGTYGAAGETLGCHQYHADLAATVSASVHCPHAGPYGGGVCGSNACADYCLLASSQCQADAGYAMPYSSMGECVANVCDSGAFPLLSDAAPFNAPAPAGPNTLNCLEWHDVHALQAPVPHCMHLEIDGGGLCGHL